MVWEPTWGMNSQLSQLAEPLWTDPGLEKGISMHELTSLLKICWRQYRGNFFVVCILYLLARQVRVIVGNLGLCYCAQCHMCDIHLLNAVKSRCWLILQGNPCITEWSNHQNYFFLTEFCPQRVKIHRKVE